jgi:hypothetical protein
VTPRDERPAPDVPVTDARLRGSTMLAELMDRAFRVPGTSWRFGLDPLLGLIPGFGDLFAGGFAAYLIVAGARLGVPRSVLARMVLNIIIDTSLGTIPVAGDLFDAAYKANVRNLRLLERWVEAPGEARRASRAFVAGLLLALLLTLVAGILAALLLVRWLWRLAAGLV